MPSSFCRRSYHKARVKFRFYCESVLGYILGLAGSERNDKFLCVLGYMAFYDKTVLDVCWVPMSSKGS